jgi:hypothetical protein
MMEVVMRKRSIYLSRVTVGVILLAVSLSIMTSCDSAGNQSLIGSVVNTLTSDEYEGRLVGSKGSQKTVAFLEQEMQSLGLTPLFGDSYLQPLTALMLYPNPQTEKMTLHFADGTSQELRCEEDFCISTPTESFSVTGTPAMNGEWLSMPIPSGGEVRFLATDWVKAYTSHDASMSDSGVVLVTQELYDALTGGEVQEVSLIHERPQPKDTEMNNVIGLLKGKDSTKAVLVTAHFDHLGPDFQGALDNAAGVAAMLEMARSLSESGEQPPIDVVFAALDGEEVGLQGAWAILDPFTERYPERLNLNLDCVGLKDGPPLLLGANAANSEELAAALQAAFTNANIATSTDPYMPGDHVALISDMPAVGIGHHDDTVNTVKDVRENLDAKLIDQIADTLADFILSNGENLVSGNTTPADNLEQQLTFEEKARQMAEEIRVRENLQINEGYGFELDGQYCVATGGHPFSSIEELHEYFPSITVVRELPGFTLQSIQVGLPQMGGLYFPYEPESIGQKFTYELRPDYEPTVMVKYTSEQAYMAVTHYSAEDFSTNYPNAFMELEESGEENLWLLKRSNSNTYNSYAKATDEGFIVVNLEDAEETLVGPPGEEKPYRLSKTLTREELLEFYHTYGQWA